MRKVDIAVTEFSHLCIGVILASIIATIAPSVVLYLALVGALLLLVLGIVQRRHGVGPYTNG